MYVYRFLNKENEVIYIGRTKNLQKRFEGHNHLPKYCYSRINKIEYITLNNNDESAIYERYLINVYNPKYNREYNNKSKFEFNLPEKIWEKFDYDFKINNPKPEIEIKSDLLVFKGDIDIEGYLIFSHLGKINGYEYNLYRTIIVSSSLGFIILCDNEDYKKEDMIDFIKYLVDENIIEIYQDESNTYFLRFNEKKLFKESYWSYKVFKKLTKEEREDILLTIK